MRHDSRVINKAVYLAIGVNMDGIKEVLGMWTSEYEGAKFWLQVVTELKNRGEKEIFIACVDGLKGFPEAIEALFSYPSDIRKAIYTTNAIESLNMSLRKITKNRGHFPSDEAVFKLLYLALRNIAKKWTMPIRDGKSALNQFSIKFEERMAHY